MCKLFQNIRDAIQSPPGKFLLALAGGLAIGGLAYQAGRSKGRTSYGVRPLDTSSIRGEINRSQNQYFSDIADSTDRIGGILSDIAGAGLHDDGSTVAGTDE